MQFSQDLRAAIEGAVRRLVGADRVVEVGFRAAANGEPVCNGLLWPSDAELQDERLLEDVERIEECPEHAAPALPVGCRAARSPPGVAACGLGAGFSLTFGFSCG